MYFLIFISIFFNLRLMAAGTALQVTAIVDECFNKMEQQTKKNSCFKKKTTSVTCDEFSDRLKDITSIDDAVVFCAGKNPKLIMLGETHFTEGIYSLYPRLLKTLKTANPELDCLFLESDPIYQNFLDDHQKCQKSSEICYKPIADLNKQLDANDKTPALRIFYSGLAATAKELKLQVFAVDPRDKMGVSDRNLEMANAIKNKLKDCKSSVMVVGSEHISATYYVELPTRKDNTADQLRRQGVSVEGILMSAESPWDKGIKIPGCSDGFQYPPVVSGMKHTFKSQIIRNLPLQFMEEVERPSYWNQFCASILIPASR